MEQGMEMEKSKRDTDKRYEPPAVVELGSLAALTLHRPKVGHACDVTCFHHGGFHHSSVSRG